MKNKKLFIVFLSVLLSSYLFASDNVDWKLYFIAENDESISGDMSKIITINDESSFQFNLVAEQDAYVYVVAENADGSIPFCEFQQVKADADCLFPQNNNFENISSSCKIHVVVLKKNNDELSKSFTTYINKKDTAAASSLLEEILKIKQNASNYMESPVKPATTGGTSRGLFAVPSSPYSDFTGSEVYVKTVRIKH